MMVLSNQLRRLPVRSLQTGQVIATTTEFLIDPASLQIVAWRCNGPEMSKQAVLLPRDLRQISQSGVLVDDTDAIADASEVVRLNNLMQQPFRLLGVPVASESGQNLGKVGDFSLLVSQLLIQKLYVKQPLWRNLLVHDLIVDRSQILDVTPKKITVRDGLIKQPLFGVQPATSE